MLIKRVVQELPHTENGGTVSLTYTRNIVETMLDRCLDNRSMMITPDEVVLEFVPKCLHMFPVAERDVSHDDVRILLVQFLGCIDIDECCQHIVVGTHCCDVTLSDFQLMCQIVVHDSTREHTVIVFFVVDK